MRSRVYELKSHGQSLWLDYIDRNLVLRGELKRMIEEDGLSGITSNPTIFKTAIERTNAYDEGCRRLTREGKNPEEIYDELTREDISMSADMLQPIFDETNGRDGYCSIELLPRLAYDTPGSIREAERLVGLIGKENVMVKVPGTDLGLEAIRRLTAEGINVNITLLFSPDQYVKVANAYIEGVGDLIKQGGDPGKVFSVASFFLSRIDTKVDKELDRMAEESREQAKILGRMRGSAAIATAKVAYGRFRKIFSSDRFRELEARGAEIQKVLWASMSTKDPFYSDVKYVGALIGPDTVVTVPVSTLAAMRDHLMVEDTLELGLEGAPSILAKLGEAGIDLDRIYANLQKEGVGAFEKSYQEVLQALVGKRRQLAA